MTPTTLRLTAGSANDIAVELVNELDAAESLAGLALTLEIRSTPDASPMMTLASPTVAGNVATFAVTQVQAAALQVGRYLGFVKGTAGGKDYRLYAPFLVEVGPG